jgi:hypothetical protein
MSPLPEDLPGTMPDWPVEPVTITTPEPDPSTPTTDTSRETP